MGDVLAAFVRRNKTIGCAGGGRDEDGPADQERGQSDSSPRSAEDVRWGETGHHEGRARRTRGEKKRQKKMTITKKSAGYTAGSGLFAFTWQQPEGPSGKKQQLVANCYARVVHALR